ncbi:uncharacterized [Tachysurus ichikawai]
MDQTNQPGFITPVQISVTTAACRDALILQISSRLSHDSEPVLRSEGVLTTACDLATPPISDSFSKQYGRLPVRTGGRGVTVTLRLCSFGTEKQIHTQCAILFLKPCQYLKSARVTSITHKQHALSRKISS